MITTTLMCVAFTIYMESRGEPEAGRVGVGLVVLNRAEEKKKSACEIIAEPYQFSWYKGPFSLNSEITDLKGWELSLASARKAIAFHKHDTTKVKYFVENRIRPKWTKNLIVVATIGGHTFYADKKGG